MALIIKETKSYDPIPADIHMGVCVWLYDVGTHENQYGKKSRRGIISFELPEVRIDIDHDGQVLNLPRMISKEYTLSLHKKANLRLHLEAWRGSVFSPEELKGFDLQKILGKNAMLQVVHEQKDNGEIRAKLNAILPLYKGLTGKEPENPIRFFSFDESTEIPENTPEWIVNRMKEADEWAQFAKTLAASEAEPRKPAFMNEEAAPPADKDDDNGKPPF